ncbi:MAG: hypothetical protein R3192_11880 [Woeseiaceae bacterium]|nr:hypothetical protein [Woeseiaceae bacterium]
MTETIVRAIEGGPINTWVLSTYWLWPLLEILHFIGLSLLLGSMLVVDLRLAGYLRQIDIKSTHRLVPWAAAGFTMNLISGVLFFFGDPARYSINIGFQIKMILVLLAGLNVLVFSWKINPHLDKWDPHGDSTMLAKSVAWVSLITWSGVLLLGRLIPYIGTG